MARRTALVTGATGVIGRYLLMHLPPNFYYHQHDLLEQRQRGKRWTWSAVRPHAANGFRGRESDEPDHGDRGVCCDLQGAWPASVVSRQAGRVSHALTHL